MPRALFDILGNHSLDENACFLCGVKLNEAIRSDEHVFPKWLQHKFGLWDRSLTLLNGTTTPYRQLKIPCCKQCNNNYLSPLELIIKTNLFQPNGSPGLPTGWQIYQWTAKIIIGVLYRELLLPFDRRDPNSPSILDKRTMSSFRMAHFFLQSVRVPMVFRSPYTDYPASIFLFDVQCPKDTLEAFDFRDDLHRQSIYLRLGTKGILAVFDAGAQDADVGDLFEKDSRHLLHPIQFEELGAKLFYKASLLRRIPYYLITETDGKYSIGLLSMDHPDALSTGMEAFHAGDGSVLVRAIQPPQPDDGTLFDDWKQDGYAQYLSLFTGIPLETVNSRPGFVVSFLSNDKDEFVPIDIEKFPWRR